MKTDGAEYEDEVDLRRYRRFVTAHWMVLAGCAAAGAIISVAVASFLPARYQASATLLILQPTGGTPLVLTPATAKALLVSPAMVSETINELGLNHDGITAQDLMNGALDVEPVAATNLVRIDVTLRDPSAARKIASLLASKAVELMNRVERDAPSAERPALEKQLNEADQRVKDAARRLVDFQANGNLDALDAERRANNRRRADVDQFKVQLDGERARLATLEQELARRPEQHSMLEHEIALSRATLSRLETEQRQTLAIASGRGDAARRAELYQRKMELAGLRSDYKARTREYEDIRSRYERTVTLSAQLYVVAPPSQPEQPLPRRRRQFASLGVIVGLVCGIVLSAVIDGRRLRVSDPVNTSVPTVHDR